MALTAMAVGGVAGDCPGTWLLRPRPPRAPGACAQKSASAPPVSVRAVVEQALPAGSSADADGVHVRVLAFIDREPPPPDWVPSVTVTAAPLIVIVALNVALDAL